MKNQGFIKGAIILIMANAISKILGAVFKIPLTYILHEDGMSLWNSAFTVYSMGLSLVMAGFPICISREVSKAVANDEYQKAEKTIRASQISLTILGLIGGLVIYIGADFFAYALKEPDAAMSIRAVSPAVVAVALGAVYKSYFQGIGNMNPTAISQIIESVIRLALGIVLACYFSSSVRLASAGAISSIMIGEFIATFILFIFYRKNRLYNRKIKTDFLTYKTLFAFSLPLMVASVLSNMISMVELSVIKNSLTGLVLHGSDMQKLISQFGERFSSPGGSITLTMEGANWLYGSYSGYAVTLFHLPVGIIQTFSISIFPYIAGENAKNNKKKTARAIEKGILTVTLLAVPCAVLMYYLSDELLFILFQNSVSSNMLKILSASVVPIVISGMCSNALYASGAVISPFIAGVSGSAVKIALCAVLVSNPHYNIMGVAIAAFFDILTVTVINLILLYKRFPGIKIGIPILKLTLGGIAQAFFAGAITKRLFLASVPVKLIFTSLPCLIIYSIIIFVLGIRKSFYISSTE